MLDIIMLILFVLFMIFVFGGYHKNKSAQREEGFRKEKELKKWQFDIKSLTLFAIWNIITKIKEILWIVFQQ